MILDSLKKPLSALAIGSMLVFGAAACGDSDDVVDAAGDAASGAVDAAEDAAGDAADVAEDAASDAVDAAEDAAGDAADAAEDAASDAGDAMSGVLSPADASLEEITEALEGAGVTDGSSIAQTIKDNAPFTDVDSLKAALPDLDDATITAISKVIHIG